MRKIAAFPLVILFAFPLIASLLFALVSASDLSAWKLLFVHPQLWPALELSVFTGLVSAFLSLLLALFIVAGLYQSPQWSGLSLRVGVMLAVPHVAMAIGFSFLIMPSGLLARAISALFTGWLTPPQWITIHDPYGLALIAALVLKETPFLIWVIVSILNRDDVRNSFAGQRSVSLSLGHGKASLWLRIYLPQLLPKLLWPILVIFTYAATVVDMALIIGPTQPPTMATLVWADINDAQVMNNARGGAGAWFLTVVIAITAVVVWSLAKVVFSRRGWLAVGPKGRALIRPSGTFSPPKRDGRRVEFMPFSRLSLQRGEGAQRADEGSCLVHLKLLGLILIYILIAATLLVLSLAPLWPFPRLWPETLSLVAWLRVWDTPSAFITSLILAISTTATALALVTLWMETQPQVLDKFVIVLSAIALGVPAILLALGQYRVFLQLDLTGSVLGLFLAHLLPVTAYMFIVLVGPYRSFDPRWRASASGLLVSFPRFFWAVKLLLLKAPLLAASAIGFAVSFGQYVPAQLVAAGRYSTLPMEAITLTSGTNRPLTAAFTLLLMVPPLLAFMAAAYFGKSRWRQA